MTQKISRRDAVILGTPIYYDNISGMMRSFLERLLRDKQLDFVEIADLFNFSSASYFTRYVQRYLGESPSEYRG